MTAYTQPATPELCCICDRPAGVAAYFCREHWPDGNDGQAEPDRYFHYTKSPEEDRLAWILIKLCQGFKEVPAFPLDKVPSSIKAGTGIYGAVKAAVSVSSLAGRFTDLKQAGPEKMRGRCPLHEEKTGSFYVFQTTETWRCFGACARGGDVIELARLLMDKGLLT